MATFVDKEYPLRSANAGFMPTLVHAFFWTPLREIDLQRCNPSVAVLFSRDAYQQRRGMQTVRRVGSGVDDSQSVELRDRGGMAVTVLTLQQF